MLSLSSRMTLLVLLFICLSMINSEESTSTITNGIGTNEVTTTSADIGLEGQTKKIKLEGKELDKLRNNIKKEELRRNLVFPARIRLECIAEILYYPRQRNTKKDIPRLSFPYQQSNLI